MPILNPTAGTDFKKEHIKPGTYPATLTAITQFEMNDKDNPNGPKLQRLRWEFAITSKSSGVTKVIEGISSLAWGAPVPGRQVAKAWKWVSTILKDTPPDQFDTDDVIGAEVYVKVADKEDKTGAPYSFIEDIVLPPSEGDF